MIVGIGLVVCVAGTVTTLAGGTEERRFGATGLVREVRQATRDFFDPNAAMAAGYGTAGSCVSGRKRGRWVFTFQTAPSSATVSSTPCEEYTGRLLRTRDTSNAEC